jgi:hypothetical protein
MLTPDAAEDLEHVSLSAAANEDARLKDSYPEGNLPLELILLTDRILRRTYKL